jgi:hypothetical protein
MTNSQSSQLSSLKAFSSCVWFNCVHSFFSSNVRSSLEVLLKGTKCAAMCLTPTYPLSNAKKTTYHAKGRVNMTLFVILLCLKSQCIVKETLACTRNMYTFISQFKATNYICLNQRVYGIFQM